jgi:chemosensory pili system protein ChpA (sensor histidine kinase/response regulator)
MRLHQDINFTTLSWVKPELDETLRLARQALEAHAEDGGDRAQMQTCVAQLHQVQGTLRMLELYGATMVAEEMEHLAQALLERTVEDRDQAYGALMRGTMQLPDYLERLQTGHKDIPVVLLPLLNDLRAARGEQGVPESVLFTVDLTRPLPPSARGPLAPLPEAQRRDRVEALRATYQAALLQWLRNDNDTDSIAVLTDVCTQLVGLTQAEAPRKLFWVAAGTFDALRAGAFSASKQFKQALTRVEREIKRLAEDGESAFLATPPADLIRQLLYYVAHAPTDHGRIGEIREVFGLVAQTTPDETELAHARSSLAGHNRELLTTVASGIKEDLLRVKEALDLHLRTPNAAVADLAPQGDALGAIADTLGMLGLGVPRRVVQDQRGAIQALTSGLHPADESALLDIAGALLYVEASLDDQVARLGQATEPAADDASELPAHESQQALDALVKESVANFVQARQCFVGFIEAGWDHAQLDDVPRLLDEVSGAMQILELPRPAKQLHALSVFTRLELLRKQRVPDAMQMDRLADALASLEYYLEALRDRRPQRERILELAEAGLTALGYWPVPQAAEDALAEPEAQAEAELEETASADAAYAEVAPMSAMDRAEADGAELATPLDVLQPEPAAAAAAGPVATTSSAPAFGPVGFEAGGEDIDDEIREVFLEELEEEITNLQHMLVSWRESPHDNDRVRPVRRVFHTLKGSGRLVGALTLGEFSWKIENMLNRVLDGSRPASPAVLALVGQAADALPQLHAALTGKGRINTDLDAMKEIADRVGAGEDVLYVPAAPVVEAIAEPEVAAVEPIAEPVAAEPEHVEPAFVEPAFVETEMQGEPASVDPVLLEILRAEVGTHLLTLQDWVDASAVSRQPATDALLRAVHTMNGAFAMTEVPVITDVLAPTESYIRRLLAYAEIPSAEGVNLLGDTAIAVLEVLEALHRPAPRIAPQDALIARAIALRDTLAEPSSPTMPMHLDEAEEAEADEALHAGVTGISDFTTLPAYEPSAEEMATLAVPSEHEATAAEESNAESAAAQPSPEEVDLLNAVSADTSATEFHTELTAFEEPAVPEQIEAEPETTPESEAVSAWEADMAGAQMDTTADAEIERLQAERAEAERREYAQLEAEYAEADRLTAARAEADRIEAERVAAEKAETDRIEAERVAAEAAEAERVEAERVAAEKAEADRVAAEEAEAERVAAEQAEAERVEAERVAAEQAEAERIAAEKAEAERVAAEKVEADRVAAEKAALERVAAEKAAAEAAASAKKAPKRGAKQPEVAEPKAVEPAVAGFMAGMVDVDPDGPLDLTDVDPELLDIFVEETTDVLDHADGLLSRLRDAPTDREPVTGLQRDLHTLKGGARMTGMMSMGELAHAMESVLEASAENRIEIDTISVGALERGFDRLHSMLARIQQRQAVALPERMIAEFTALGRGQPLPAPAPTAAPEVAADHAEPAVEKPARAVPTLKPLSAPVEAGFDEDDEIGVRAPQEQVRIRADLLDRLVNYAGEVAIYRARLEQQLGGFRGYLNEMEITSQRLRDQLRKLEIETEAQIMARYQRAGEDDETAFDPLELDRFSTQQQLTRALAETAADIVSLQGSLDDITSQYETLLLQQSRVSSDLQEGLMRTRMVPFDALVPRLRRVLRQAGGETGKQVQLKVDGAQGEMDRNVLDRMTAPLEHMLRNSVVHGLETPAERRAAGKPDEGSVTVSVRREGSEVVMVVADDGRGLNRDAIQAKALERGLLKLDMKVSDQALYAFILESGFSTAETVGRLAGRGVGMDVVHNEIRQLGGSLQLDSTPGRGSRFTIRLPFTLAVTQAALVKIGETSFAVPISSVQGVGRIARNELEKQLASGKPVYMYAGEEYAIYDLGKLLGQAPARAQGSLQMPLLLSRSGDQRTAICVDEVQGSREIVVKPVGAQVSSVPGIFGATIMGDGGVMVILDVVPLVRRQLTLVESGAAPAPAHEVRRVPLVMVVDDSITMRKVTGRVLERNNMEVLAAKDGIDAIEKMVERVPDLMLLDIEMPRMDGYELATHMRNDPRLRDVPIVMITSRTGEKHRQRAFEIGVNRYLGKPYQEAELMRNVFDLLDAEHHNA